MRIAATALLCAAALGCNNNDKTTAGAPSGAPAARLSSAASASGAAVAAGSGSAGSGSASGAAGPGSAAGSASAPAGSGSAAVPTDAIGADERAEMSGRILFISERDNNREVYAVLPNGEQLTRITRDEAEDYPAAQHPRAPQLLLIRTSGGHQHNHQHQHDQPHNQGHAEQLMLLPYSAAEKEPPADSLKPLGKAGSKVRNPSWFPSGQKLAFEADFDGFRDIYAVDIKGDTERLTEDPKGSFEPSVSPDGKSIVFVSSREDDAEIYLMHLPGKALDRLTWSKGDDSFPTFSPDGEHIAFVSMRAKTPRLHIMGKKGSKPRLLGGDVHAEHIEDKDIAFSPDGEHIAMTRRRKGFSEVVVVRIKDGSIVTRSGAVKSDEMPAWSPDGRYLAFASDRSGDTEIYLMRRDGSAIAPLTKSPGPDWLPRWVASPAAKP